MFLGVASMNLVVSMNQPEAALLEHEPELEGNKKTNPDPKGQRAI